MPEQPLFPTVGPRWCVDLMGGLAAAVPELTSTDWSQLRAFEGHLRRSLATRSIPESAAERPAHLLGLREELATTTTTDATTARCVENALPAAPDLVQTMRQLICGFYDLDLRDASGAGHGRIILHHGSDTARKRWAPRLAAGALAGIAMTEQIGGARIREITTQLTPAQDGSWTLSGEKVWISRLNEASVFVVFARTAEAGAGEDGIAAVVVDAADPALVRHPETPTGLQGWSWGRLSFDRVSVNEHDILCGRADAPSGMSGLGVFYEHFAHYRALVTATALGAAVAAADIVAAHLAARLQDGQITRVRDHALIALGRSHAALHSSILAVLHTQRLAATGSDAASLWGRTTKAFGVETARDVADELVVLTGAAGFTAGSRLQKIRRDLDALRYADGMHDSLNRSAGQQLLSAHLNAPEGPDHDLTAPAPVPEPRREQPAVLRRP